MALVIIIKTSEILALATHPGAQIDLNRIFAARASLSEVDIVEVTILRSPSIR